MPYERGSSPVPPTEFSCAALADPKARFCRSLASHSPLVNGDPAYPFDPKALNYIANLAVESLALPPPADACVPIHNHKKRASQTSAIP